MMHKNLKNEPIRKGLIVICKARFVMLFYLYSLTISPGMFRCTNIYDHTL